MNRNIVFNKYNGRCAFCGDQLQKGWHVWDVVPIQTVVTEDGKIEKINTEIGNLMPACKSCGSLRIKCSFEGKMDTERFRKEIIEMYEFARDHAMYASSIQRALKYGMIVETNKPLRFYFETIGITSN